MNLRYSALQPIIVDSSISIEKGKVTLVIGRNGQGKSTLLKGFARIEDVMMTSSPSISELYSSVKKVFYYSADDLLFEEINVIDYLLLDYDECTWKLGAKYELFLQKVRSSLNFYNFVGEENTLISQLSTGNRIILKFLNLTLQDYDLLLIDEPSNHLDGEKLQLLLSLLIDHVESRGSYCLLVSHDDRVLNDKRFENTLKYKIIEGQIHLTNQNE